MAQRLSDHAIKHHSFQFSLWVFLKRKCGRRALQESIDHQLSILNEEWEVEDDNKETKEKEEIQENWEEKISKALEGKRFLLILDDEGNGMKEEIKDLLKFCWQKSSKVLITASKRDGSHESEEVGVKVIEVKPLSMEESLYLFKERAGEEVNKLPGIEPLAEDFLQKTKYLPAAAIMVAKALSYFGQHDSGRQTLESALEEAFGNESYNITQLLCSGYNKLPEGVLIDCCWGGSHFFRDGGGVHYNELIAYWIMEGYLGHVDCIEKAYEMGHHVIMQLIDCRMLIMMEGGYVIMEGAIMNSVDCHRSGFGGTASLGLANVFEDGEWEGLGRIIQADGMIRTLCCGKEGQKVSSLLLDGNRPWREVLDNFPKLTQELQTLALFNPTLISLPLPLPEMHNFCVLVLRGCDFLGNISLNDIDSALKLEKLTVLEISGSGSLRTIPDNLFKHMPHLRSLNLSALQIQSLPSSLYDLGELVWLVLRGCSCLETLGSLKKFEKLLGLDLSGATSLKNLEKLPDLNFLTKLEMLDLSGCCALTGIQHKSSEPMSHLQTQELLESTVECQPSLSILSNLRHLLLKECTKLSVLPRLDSLSKLEELNLCGIISLKDIGADFLECMTHLQILDLSGTMLGKLPSMLNLKSLKQLYLRGLGLERVPGLEALTQLVVLDLSGTSVSCLPSLDNFTNLRRLLLRDCSRLEKFLELEMLDLLGATVKDLPYGISKLTHLERLDLPHINNITGADIGRTNQYQWSISSFPAVIGSDRSSVSKSQFAQFKEQRSLEIRGFHDSPKGIEDVLSHAECVFLIDNEFKTLLSDLRASNLLAMRGCWIERCREMQSLFCENEAEDISQVGRTLEILGVSNALNLTSICSGDMKFEVFQKLKCLYLDCCPNISTVFSSSLLPENLKVLQIKFCDKLVTVFQQTSGECILRNLDTLHLWELPELKSIGCALPSLQTLKVQECPKLQKLEEHIKSAESLQILWISNVTDLKSICSGSQQPGSFKNLQSLTLESCPMLENVLSSPCLLENLETLKIKYCEKLETLFEQSTPVDYKLPKLLHTTSAGSAEIEENWGSTAMYTGSCCHGMPKYCRAISGGMNETVSCCLSDKIDLGEDIRQSENWKQHRRQIPCDVKNSHHLHSKSICRAAATSARDRLKSLERSGLVVSTKHSNRDSCKYTICSMVK
ncbi:hypothetical protein F0562_014183 [Nyssa sinensis]|uniref:Uncharacterized protein n=1 Tax=Nyssa sinensis TaxID=561372 RepID=A0A5J4ZRW7_9ASTE|nr:hypothetical protein F0562_014183 [Nyssa sinensis]